MKSYKKIILFLLLFLSCWRPVRAQEEAPTLPTPAEIIDAVNSLRLAYGLAPLAVHPILMQIAQEQANGIASGFGGHWRPNEWTLGQWLMMSGYPLSGDLSQDGYRSENFTIAGTAQDAVNAWLSDDPHTNTMLSPNRSDIGAGVASDGEFTYIVLETALQTSSGKFQHNAYPTMTALAGAPQSVVTPSGSDGVSQYVLPVIMNTALPNGDVYHEVQYGQTLWSIAITYQTTIREIQRLNNLMGNEIQQGKTLLVIQGATQSVQITFATPAPTASPTGMISPSPLPAMSFTPTLQPLFIYSDKSGQSKRDAIFGGGAIALTALLMGGVFAAMTKKRPI